ncbi:MAG: Rrf2 family transcriptional regulator [Planctomycetota bacterium]
MISKRARYALHGVGFLAYYHGRGPLSFKEILQYLSGYSNKLSLSPGYIARVFQDLSRAGIVQSTLGRKGGYSLARAPGEIRILDIVAATDGDQLEECCLLSTGGCSNQATCGVNSVINQAQRTFFEFLASEDVGSLAQKMFGVKAPLELPERLAEATPAQETAVE